MEQKKISVFSLPSTTCPSVVCWWLRTAAQFLPLVFESATAWQRKFRLVRFVYRWSRIYMWRHKQFPQSTSMGFGKSTRYTTRKSTRYSTIVESKNQERFSLNVWGGIVGDCLIGPVLLPSRLFRENPFGENYHRFLSHTTTVRIRHRMWFLHDGSSAHFSRLARTVWASRKIMETAGLEQVVRLHGQHAHLIWIRCEKHQRHISSRQWIKPSTSKDANWQTSAISNNFCENKIL